MLLNLTNSKNTSKLLIARTALEVETFITNLPSKPLVFLDIDDTIITPISKTFRTEPYWKLIDDIKKNKDHYPDYVTIVSRWRLQRKIQLIDPQWPEVLNRLTSKFRIFGLTKMDTGKFGDILSMEEWRWSELQKLGIEFSSHPQIEPLYLSGKNQHSPPPIFHKGIFMTGSASKGEVLGLYTSLTLTDTLVMVDDRTEYLEDVEAFCQKESIQFVGILFKGVEGLPGKQKASVAEFQKDYLIQHKTWLEDEEAIKLMSLVKPI